MRRNHQCYEMNNRERSNYEQLYQEIGQNILEAKEEIRSCKELLLEARKKRKNRHEYDALAKVIEKHPDRTLTLREIQCLEKELHSSKDTREKIAKKLEKRKKQFHVLIHSVQVLEQILNDDLKDSCDEKGIDADQMDTT